MAKFDENGSRELEYRRTAGKTVVHDLNAGITIMEINGVLVLPVGAEIELMSPNVNVTVERVRLLAGSDNFPMTVCLDVRVPDEYYKQK